MQKNKTYPKKNVLIVTYAFPPVNVVGANRPFFLCKYLPDYGWNPFVISRKVWAGASIDKDMSLPKDNPTRIYRCRDIWDFPFFRGRIFSWIFKPVFIPDEFIFFNISVFFKTLKTVISKKIDVVIYTAPPVSSFFGALAAAKLTGKPFVADFRDLWTLHEYFKIKAKNSIRRKIENLMEKVVITYSDMVILNTKKAKHKMENKYPQLNSNLITITNGADNKYISDIPEVVFDKFTIAYTGSFYLERNPIFFLECLSEWIFENSDIRDDIQVIFAGKNVQAFHETVKHYKLNGIVKLYDQLPKKKMYGYLKASHVLLILLGFLSESDYVVPAKLYEYMAFNKPIIGFVPPNGEAERIIKEMNIGTPIVEKNKKSVKDALNIYFENYKKGKSNITLENFPLEYDYRNIAMSLSENMDSLLQNS